MLEILEQKNLGNYQEILKKIKIIIAKNSEIPGLEYAEIHISEAIENKNIKGWILYAYQPEQVIIYEVSDGGDWNQCDGLVRSVLFKAQLRGINQAWFLEENPAMIQRLAKLGFMKNNQKKLNNIMDVMENCKKCKENPANT
ncbi:MAG: hypothetical protein K2H29_09050 [Oscillospiraceae bacterium]|nr:hypothetical protein [Oscillospiraceae bacterium]